MQHYLTNYLLLDAYKWMSQSTNRYICVLNIDAFLALIYIVLLNGTSCIGNSRIGTGGSIFYFFYMLISSNVTTSQEQG